MEQFKKILILSISSFILSCVSTKYVDSYESVNVFLKTQKLGKKKYILQSDKGRNKQALRIFNRGEGAAHIIDSSDPVDYTDDLFVEKHWRKMYRKYAKDTIKKYWKKEDFPGHNFFLEKGTGLTLKYDIGIKYMNSGIEDVIVISEPMYYWNKKYIMFYFNIVSFSGSLEPQVVIMKKEKKKWIVVKVIGDYVYY
ncbi:hypothetical protein [Flavobacterium lipolyticum]|uniref:Lipoprotein n=1 Tax=Flavobacterium lipolyticum TaxID=2893754 RepID=A0ABS8M1G4_9FLAO|nr:hypothetical protein [Flavobacterium sp. F-126]MCC9018167.1 hypothetical protein [Flavobacterium sp. F-126]